VKLDSACDGSFCFSPKKEQGLFAAIWRSLRRVSRRPRPPSAISPFSLAASEQIARNERKKGLASQQSGELPRQTNEDERDAEAGDKDAIHLTGLLPGRIGESWRKSRSARPGPPNGLPPGEPFSLAVSSPRTPHPAGSS